MAGNYLIVHKKILPDYLEVMAELIHRCQDYFS